MHEVIVTRNSLKFQVLDDILRPVFCGETLDQVWVWCNSFQWILQQESILDAREIVEGQVQVNH